MKVIVLYRPVSEYATMVETYLRDFKMQTGKELSTLDVDSPEGIELCRLYDVVNYPAILAIGDNGSVQNAWLDGNLPRVSELSYYVPDREPTLQGRQHPKKVK